MIEDVLIPPIAKRARLSDQVVETLSRLIVEGVLEPGTLIRSEDVARQLGVSRTPVREALQRLEADGLVSTAPSGVAKVAAYEIEEALELMDVREVVDGLAARLLAGRGLSDATLAELSALVEGMHRASQADDKHGFLALNARFHSAMLSATNHRPLQQLHSLVRITSQAVYLRLGHMPARHQQSAREHSEILAAIRARDAALAERLARQHIRRAAEFWLEGGHKSGAKAARHGKRSWTMTESRRQETKNGRKRWSRDTSKRA